MFSKEDFNKKYMVVDKQYEHEIEEVTDEIVQYLAQGGTLTTNDIFRRMSGVRFSEDFVKAVHSMVCRKLNNCGRVLVCYPHIDITYSTPMNVVVDYYVYQATPIDVPELRW